MNIIEAAEDPNLFGHLFQAPSWRRWKVFLKALQALPMSDDELAIFRHHTRRTAAPGSPARYAELVVGRRGGKSRVLALVAVYIASFPDHRPFLVPGEIPVIAVIAADRKQARVILGYIVGLLRAVPMLAKMIEDEMTESVILTNGVVIEVHTASIASPRGRTFLAVLADEIAFWPMGDSANPDVEVITAVRPGLSTIPYSLLLIASSPYARRGLLFSNYSRYFGRDDAPVLVWQGPTIEMNATLADDALIAEMYEEDPERAAAEFGAQFRTDIVAFITRDAVEAVVAHGMRELPPSAAIEYVAFTDPSGGSADSMTLAIAHMEREGTAVLDAVRECKPPFSPDAVVQEFAALLKSYGVSRVKGDAYAGEWPRERFAVHGITYDVSEKNKSAIYQEFLPGLNGQRVRLLDVPRLIGQLVTLERRTARGGRDTIDHAPGCNDDLANACCGALVQVIADRRPALVRPADVLSKGAGLPIPAKTRYVLTVIVCDKRGTAAVVYAARTADDHPPLVILDFDVQPFHGALFATVAERLAGFADETKASDGVFAFAQTRFVQHARGSGLHAEEIPPRAWLMSDDLLFGAASHVAANKVKLCQAAAEKSEKSPLGGALNFKAADVTDDPLRASVLLVIALALEPADAFEYARV